MIKADVFICTEPEYTQQVLGYVRKVGRVREAHIVYGMYDIIARVETETLEKLDPVSREIRNISKIRDTVTSIHRD